MILGLTLWECIVFIFQLVVAYGLVLIGGIIFVISPFASDEMYVGVPKWKIFLGHVIAAVIWIPVAVLFATWYGNYW